MAPVVPPEEPAPFPLDDAALSEATISFQEAGDWDGLFTWYSAMGERAPSEEDLGLLWKNFERMVRSRAAEEPNPIRAAHMLRMTGEVLHRHLGAADRALEAFRDAFTRYPSPEILDQARELLGDDASPEQALEIAEARLAVTQQASELPGAVLAVAEAAARAGYSERARKALEEILATQPDHADAQRILRGVEADDEATTRRIEGLRRAVERSADGAAKARALQRLGDGLHERRAPGGTAPATAVEAWLASLAGHPTADAVQALTRHYRLAGDAGGLRDVLEQAIRPDGGAACLALGHQGLADLAHRSEDFSAERTHLEALCGLDPRNSEALERLTKILRDDKAWEALRKVLHARIRLADHGEGRDLLELELAGLLDRELHETDAASLLYGQLRKRLPEHPDVLRFEEARCRAREDWTRLHETLGLRIRQESGKAQFDLALERARLARTHLALSPREIEAWEDVLTHKPRNREARQRVLQALEETGRWAGVVAFREAEFGVQHTRGNTVQALGELDAILAVHSDPARAPSAQAAVDILERIITLDPGRHDALDRLAGWHRDRGEREALIGVLERSSDASLSPETRDEIEQELLALHAGVEGEAGLALTHVQSLRSRHPADLDLLRTEREMHRRAGDLSAVANLLEAELEQVKGEDRVPLLDELALISEEELGDPDSAVAALSELHGHRPNSAHVFERLGACHERLMDWEALAALIDLELGRDLPRSRRITLLDRLAGIQAEGLHSHGDARMTLVTLLRLHPFHRDARTRLQGLDGGAGSWLSLRKMHAAEDDWQGYASLLEDAVQGDLDLEGEFEIRQELTGLYTNEVPDPRRARIHRQAAFGIHPEDMSLASELAESLEAMGDWPALRDVLMTMVEQGDDALRRHAIQRLRKACHEAGDRRASVEWASAWLEDLHPEEPLPDLAQVTNLVTDAASFDRVLACLTHLSGQDRPAEERIRIHQHMGDFLMASTGRMGDARQAYGAALAIDPGSRAALGGLEKVLIAEGEWHGLRDALEAFVAADNAPEPALVQRLAQLGELNESVLDDPEGAFSAWKATLVRSPLHEAALSGVKRHCVARGQWAELLEVLQRELTERTEGEGRGEVHHQIATVQREQMGDLPASVASYGAVLAHTPAHRPARSALEGLLESGVETATILPLLDHCYTQTGSWKPLARILQRRLKGCRDPADEREYKRRLAYLHGRSLDDPATAWKLLETLVREDPDDVLAWGELRDLAPGAGAEEVLVMLFGTMTGIAGPGGPRAPVAMLEETRSMLLQWQGTALVHLGRLVEAHAVLSERTSHEDASLDALQEHRDVLRALGRWSGLEGCLQQITRHPGQIPDRIELAEVRENELADLEGASAAWLEVLQADPDNVHALAEAERTLRALADGDGLCELLQNEVDRRPEDVEVALRLAAAHVSLRDDVVGALKVLSDTWHLNPSHDGVLEALEVQALSDAAHASGAGEVACDQIRDHFRDHQEWSRVLRVDHTRLARAVGSEERAALHLAIARVHGDALGDPEEALVAACNALEESPDRRDAADEVLRFGGRAGRWREVSDALFNVLPHVDEGRQITLSMQLAGFAREELDSPSEAITHCLRVLGIDPLHLEALSTLDELHGHMGAFEERLAVLERMAALVPAGEQPGVLGRALDMARLVEDRPAEMRLLLQLTRTQGTPVDTLLDCLDARIQLHGESGEHADLVEALDMREGLADAPDVRLALLHQKGETLEHGLRDLQAAVRTYERVRDLDPVDGLANDALARLYRETGMLEELEGLLTWLGSALPSGEARCGHQHVLAQLLSEREGRGSHAVAVYEDLLNWNGHDEAAIEGLWSLSASPDSGAAWAASMLLAVSARDRDVPDEIARALRLLLSHSEVDQDTSSLWQELANVEEERLGDFPSAYEAFISAWSARPLDGQLWRDCTRLALELSDPDPLHQAVSGCLESLEDPTARIGVSLDAARHFALDWERLDLAEGLYTRTLTDNPEHPDALQGLEDVHRQQGQWEQLASVLGIQVDRGIGVRREHILERTRLLSEEMGDHVAATTCVNLLLAEAPGDPDGLAALDAVLTREGSWDALTEVIARRSRLHEPESREAARLDVRGLQIVHGRLKDPERAQRIAESLLGNAYAEDDAIVVLRALFDDGHSRAEVLPNLIAGYEARARWHDLAHCLETRIADEPDDECMLLSQLVHVLRHKLGEDARAFVPLCRLASLSPDHALLDALEDLADRLDLWEELSGHLEAWAEAADPTWAIALDLRAAAIQRGRASLADRAVESYRRVLARDPSHRAAGDGLLATLEMQGAWEEHLNALLQLAQLPDRQAERRDLHLRAAMSAEERLHSPLRAVEILSAGMDRHDADDVWWEQIESLLQGAGDDALLRQHYGDWASIAQDPNAIHVRHARHRGDAGEWGAVHALLQQCLTESPEHSGLVRLLEEQLDAVPLEAEIAAGVSARSALGSLLASVYTEETPWERWMHVTDARISCAHEPTERRALLVFAGSLLRDRARNPHAAFARFAEALRMAPADMTVLDLVTACAEDGEILPELLSLLESLGRQGGEEAAGHALRAASIAEHRLFDDGRARELHRLVLELDPGHSVALDALERHSRALSDSDGLLEVLALRIASTGSLEDQASWYREMGSLHLQADRHSAGIGAIRACLRLCPDDPEGQDDLIAALRVVGDHPGLVGSLVRRASNEEDPVHQAGYLEDAAQVLEQELDDIPGAIDLLYQIHDSAARSDSSHRALARLLPRVDDWDGLAQLLSLRLTEAPEGLEAAALHRELGDLHRAQLGATDQALDHYRLALHALPGDPATISSLEELLAKGDHALAASYVLEAEHEASGDHARLSALHVLQLPLLEDPLESLELLNRAIRLLCDTQGDADGAVRILLDSLAGNLSFADVQPLLAEILADHAVHETATTGLITRLAGQRVAGDERAIRRWIAEHAEGALGDGDEAAHQWRRLVDLDPSNAQDRAQLERVLREQKRWGDLVVALEEHLDYATRETRGDRLLELAAICSGELSEPHRALTHLRDLLWEDQSNDRAQEAMADLASSGPDTCEEVFEILAPIHRNGGRYDALVELLEVQQNWLEEPAEVARCLIQRMEILGTRLKDESGAFNAGILALRTAGELGLPHVEYLEALAGSEAEMALLGEALRDAAEGPVSPRVRTELHLHGARHAGEFLKRPDVEERHLLAVLNEQPQHRGALQRLERLYRGGSRHAELVALAERQVLLPMESGERARLLLLIGDSSLQLGDTTRAAQAMESILTREAGHPQALSTLRKIHLQSDNPRAAMPLFRREADQPGLDNKRRIELLLTLARLEESDSETQDAAVTTYEDILSHDPLHEEALGGLEALHVASGRWDALAWVLRQRLQSVSSATDLLTIHRTLGRIHMEHMDEPLMALNAFGEALALDPHDAESQAGSLDILEGQGLWQDQAHMLERLVAAGGAGDRVDSHGLRLARLRRDHLEDPMGAVDAAARVLEANPHSMEALQIIASSPAAAQDGGAILAAVEGALEVGPAEEDALTLLRLKASLLMEGPGDAPGALEALLRAARIAPGNPDVDAQLGDIYRARGRWDALVEVLDRQFQALDDSREASEIAVQLAKVYRDSLQDAPRAIVWFERALSLSPDDASLTEDLVDAHPADADNARVIALLDWLLADAETRGDRARIARHAHRLGRIKVAHGDASGGLALQERAQRASPGDLHVLLSLSQGLLHAGRDEEALVPLQALQLRQAALSESERVDVLGGLAALADASGDRAKALLLARRGLAMDPERQDLLRLVEDVEADRPGAS